MDKISIIELESLQRSDSKPVLLDVRTPVEYGSGHIPTASNIPLGNANVEQVIEAAEGREIVCVCKSGSRAKRFAQELQAAGCARSRWLEGGTTAWIEQGKPIEGTGRQVMSLERQVRIGAGLLVVLGIVLSHLAHPGFIAISAFVGAGLVFAGITDWCGMALVLAKMPWNTSSCKSAKECK